MSFARKPSLGRYNGSKGDWHCAYRAARLAAGNGHGPNPSHTGLRWKAALIVANDRGTWGDPLLLPVSARLHSQRVISEILAEEAPTSGKAAA